MLIAQQSLESYRAESEGSSVKELAEEEHHPTEKLAKFLRAAGEPKPTSYHEAHHIVCGKGRYRQRLTYAARLRMHSFGIGINDPTNGVWLRNFEKISQMIGLRLTLFLTEGCIAIIMKFGCLLV